MKDPGRFRTIEAILDRFRGAINDNWYTHSHNRAAERRGKQNHFTACKLIDAPVLALFERRKR